MRGVKPRSSGLLIRLSPDKWEAYGTGMARLPALMSGVGGARVTCTHKHSHALTPHEAGMCMQDTHPSADDPSVGSAPLGLQAGG